MSNIIADTVEPLPQSVLDSCTVWTTPLRNDGRRYTFKYEAYDKELLMRYAEEKRAAIDFMRSPSLSTPRLQPDGLWAIDLTYYGLD